MPEIQKISTGTGHVPALRTEEGDVQVVLKPAVESIGLNYSGVLQRLRRHSWATITLMRMTAGDGKVYEYSTVSAETWTMFLATVDESRVSDEVRPLVIEFQKNSARALRDFWLEGVAVGDHATLQQLEAANERMQATIAKQRRQMEAGAQRINTYIQEADRAVQEAQKAKVDEHDALYRKIAVLDHWRQLTLMRMRRAGVEAHTLKQAENDLKSVGRL